MLDDGAAGFPATLSPSRASDYMTCPLLFRFRSIDRLPEEPSVAQLRGNLVHTALEEVFDLPAQDRTPRSVLDLAEAALARLREEDPAAAGIVTDDGPFAEAVTPLIRSYFELEDPSRLEPHGREIGVLVDIEPGFALRGFIDRVDVAPDGAVRIVDYKTGKAPKPAYEGKALFQMRFYALAWWRQHGVVPRMLQLLYLGSKQALRHAPDEAELVATERKILALRDAIASSADAGEFAPTPGKLCDWCSHRALCPSWGGSPPALPPRAQWPSAGRRPEPADGASGE